MFDLALAELLAGFGDTEGIVRSTVRLLMAMACGATIGLQRESSGKAAGLRTHILVALGSALFVVAAYGSGMDGEALARVIQGVITGIGFIGAGAILKREEVEHIRGLTTAAGIWMTAAIGVGAGLGRFGIALIATVFAWVILAVLGELEQWREARGGDGRQP